MKPHGELIKQVSNLVLGAAQEIHGLSEELTSTVVYTFDHQPPEQDDQIRISNLAEQLRRAVLVQSAATDLLVMLLKAKR